MPKKMGRPLSDNPKSYKITVRIDEETNNLLNECCEKLDKNKADVLRLGLNFVKSKLSGSD